MAEQGQFPGMEEPNASGISGGADVINNSGLKQTSQTLVTIKSNIESIRQAISQLGTQGEESIKKLTSALDELKTKSAAVGQGMAGGAGKATAAPGGGMTGGKELGGGATQPPLPGQPGPSGEPPGATQTPQEGAKQTDTPGGNGGDVTFSGKALGLGLVAYGVGAMGRQAGGMLGNAQSATQTSVYLGATSGQTPQQARGTMFAQGVSGYTSQQDMNQGFLNTLQSGQAFGSPGFKQQLGVGQGFASLTPGLGFGAATNQYGVGSGGFYSPEVFNRMRAMGGGALPYQPGGAETPMPDIISSLNQKMFGRAVPTTQQALAAQRPGSTPQLLQRQLGLSPENIQGLTTLNQQEAQYAAKNPKKPIPNIFQTGKAGQQAVTALAGGDTGIEAGLRSYAQQTGAASQAYGGMDKASQEFSKAVGGFSEAVGNFVKATGTGGALGGLGFGAAKGGGLLAGATALGGSLGQSYLTARMMKGMMPGGGGAGGGGTGGFLKNLLFGGRPGGNLSGSKTPGISNEAGLAEGAGGEAAGAAGVGGRLGLARLGLGGGPVAATAAATAMEGKLFNMLKGLDPNKGAGQRAGSTAANVGKGLMDWGPFGLVQSATGKIPGMQWMNALRPSHLLSDIGNVFGDSGAAPAPTFGSMSQAQSEQSWKAAGYSAPPPSPTTVGQTSAAPPAVKPSTGSTPPAPPAGAPPAASKQSGKQQSNQVNWRPGGRATVNALEELAKSVGIPMKVTATTKSADTDSYHQSSNAIDLGSHGGPKDQATLLRLNQQLAKKFGPGLAEMIYSAPGAVNIRDGKVVGPTAFGSKVMGQHKDHIHIAATETSLKAAGINLQGRQEKKTTQAGSRTQQPTNPQQGQQQDGGGGPVGTINNKQDFAKALLSALGVSTASALVNAIVKWENFEEPDWTGTPHPNLYNPLNTGKQMPGSMSTGSAGGMVAYKDWQTGVQATADTIRQGNMKPIYDALKAGDVQQLQKALQSSPWSESKYPGLNLGGGTAPATAGSGGAPPSTTQGPAQASSTTNKGTESAALQNINRLSEGGSITESSILAAGFVNMKHTPKSTTAPGKPAGSQQGGGGGGTAPAPGNLVHASPEAAKAYAQQVAKQRGWNFADWDFVANAESGWRWNAANPSGAYGIPQALPGSKMASAGADWHDNAGTQINWMADYMQQRWGGAAGAAAQERSAHWYHGGTWEVAQDSMAMLKKGEMVVPPGAAAMVRDQTPQVGVGSSRPSSVVLQFNANAVQINVASVGDTDLREAARKFAGFARQEMQERDLMRD